MLRIIGQFFILCIDFATFECNVIPAQITIEIGASTTLTCNIEYESGEPRPKTISYKWTRISSSNEIPFPSSATGINSKILKLVCELSISILVLEFLL